MAKIAKKFYNSTKNADVQRIVAANPKVLKDASAMLVVDKKLVIPNVPHLRQPPAGGSSRRGPRTHACPSGGIWSCAGRMSVTAADLGMVYLPSGAVTVPVPGVIGPPKKDVPAVKDAVTTKDATVAKDVTTAKKAGTYVVQSGDTLEKIARKMAPTKTTETVQKSIGLNGLKGHGQLEGGTDVEAAAMRRSAHSL